jgi:nucleoside-diphosphate kinase
MAAKNDETLLFIAEWFDPMPQLKRQYLLKYYVADHCAEMVDLKSKKMFLKKSPCPKEMLKEEFVIGGRILLYSRELDIIDYGDLKTRDRLQYQMQPSVVILPPGIYKNWGKIVDALTEKLVLVKARTVLFNRNSADSIVQVLDTNPRDAALLLDGVSLVLVVGGPDGFNVVSNLAENVKSSLGTFMYTTNGISSSSAQDMLFDPHVQDTATLDNCTCCIVKPHAVKAKLVGKIMDEIISQGYEISALKTMYFEKVLLLFLCSDVVLRDVECVYCFFGGKAQSIFETTMNCSVFLQGVLPLC